MLVTGEIYHILNRGTEERIIFQNRRDYERFLLTVFESNNITPSVENRHRRNKNTNLRSTKSKPLVEIFCLCLMPNHFHMAIKQLIDGGIAKLMQRVGNSYTKYFNIKYGRKGSLFMARYKSIHVKTDSQIRHLITYIHANPLDLIMPEWRLGKIKNYKKAKEFLKNYKWSSYPFYTEVDTDDLIKLVINPRLAKLFYPKNSDYFDAIYTWSSRYFEVINVKDLE